MEELALTSKGTRMNGLFYLASGRGNHPTVVLLHGFPGNERNLDLAQAIRRAGINVLFFSYRGAWASGGMFSFSHALEDVAAAVQFVRSDSVVHQYHTDPARVVLLGHSMGGWLALMGMAADSTILCAGGLDFWNAGASGRFFRTDPQHGSDFTAYADWVSAPGGPLHAESGQALTSELETHAEAWDVDSNTAALQTRPVLLVSQTANSDPPAFIAALRRARVTNVTALTWDTDHSFSARRIELAHVVTGWLHRSCKL
jgi:pimeloyl-ACP methyl ester carboxylesterase